MNKKQFINESTARKWVVNFKNDNFGVNILTQRKKWNSFMNISNEPVENWLKKFNAVIKLLPYIQ